MYAELALSITAWTPAPTSVALPQRTISSLASSGLLRLGENDSAARGSHDVLSILAGEETVLAPRQRELEGDRLGREVVHCRLDRLDDAGDGLTPLTVTSRTATFDDRVT